MYPTLTRQIRGSHTDVRVFRPELIEGRNNAARSASEHPESFKAWRSQISSYSVVVGGSGRKIKWNAKTRQDRQQQLQEKLDSMYPPFTSVEDGSLIREVLAVVPGEGERYENEGCKV